MYKGSYVLDFFLLHYVHIHVGMVDIVNHERRGICCGAVR